MSRRGLLIIDMLNDFLDRMEAERVGGLVASTNRLIGAFRSVRLPVIWVGNAFKADLSDAFLEMRDKGIFVAIEGTRGAEIVETLGKSSDCS